ncbi:PQQ-dependent sugar dehydrogenase [Flavobacterium caeni]|uniref:Por secretion system C-terminal sorting domain-containing protein n=1 Tax=Flavobacterium caeni TaxID=490189 RepID=A0A1G5E8M0_9FLAO|nr:PQQ-dependent sugar dehydrogenase [Flavobacterium caeni]SCY23329.1 Por secretion system C-terminal sorting domain-containing protein [Flavobacterium caeni]
MKKTDALFYLLFLLISAPFFAQSINIVPFANGFNTPVEIANAGDNRLFVVEWAGRIRIVNPDGTVNPVDFLTVPSSIIMTGSERGLLGLAFDPQYATNGYFYICYTSMPAGDVTIARYTRNPENANLALPDSSLIIMAIPHALGVHNGGTLRFGPDGYLYLGVGDGNNTWPLPHAQDINLNLGKMLRIDVSNSSQAVPYTIPPGNPFVGVEGNDEIWAVGLRNPWKYSFDRQDGTLWIADVGESSWEEINHVGSGQAGLNYGWSCYEGVTNFVNCGLPTSEVTFPLTTYAHTSNRCSIIGGYAYSGTTYPDLQNKYIFADLCANNIFAADVTTGVITTSETFTGDPYYFMTLGEDSSGELYVAGSSGIYKIIDANLHTTGFDKFGFTALPNPASSEISVKLNNNNYPAQANLIDLQGKLLLSQKLESEATQIYTSSLQNGVYILSVTDNAGSISSAKMVIAK